jgi:sulfite exporter TauE/SafE
MTALIATVMLTSLLGSLHCAGMCGAFVAFAVGIDPADRASRRRAHMAYNGGRLITYTALGTIAGAFGSAIDLGGTLAGVQRLALLGSAVLIGLFGVATLVATRRGRGLRMPAPKFMRCALDGACARAARLSATRRALVVGLLTTLLPCGWLWIFVVAAAGTSSPVWGAVTMAAFWAGTLPALVAVGAGARVLMGVAGRWLPTAMPLAMIVVAIVSVFTRAPILGLTRRPIATPVADVEQFVRDAAAEPPPCCQEDDGDR